MGVEDTEVIDNPEEEAMDRILYIIKDELPKEVVSRLYRIVREMKGLKSARDMRLYYMIEFNTKVDAEAAKSKGINFEHNGENHKVDFSLVDVVALYMAQTLDGNTIGHGY